MGFEPKMQIQGKVIQIWLSREEEILADLKGNHNGFQD